MIASRALTNRNRAPNSRNEEVSNKKISMKEEGPMSPPKKKKKHPKEIKYGIGNTCKLFNPIKMEKKKMPF